MNDIIQSFLMEFRRIFAYKSAFGVLVLGVAIYSVLYPQPYLNEALRDVPIAIVDLDGTEGSRDLARRIDATPDVAVVQRLPDIASAEREVYARTLEGILVIPQYFERELLHGRPSPVALYGDASYFLIYQRVAAGVTAAARTLGVEIEARRLVGLGVDPAIATAAVDPMPLTAIPLFNPQGGYATYVLPAAFVLILQQTLLIGVGLLGTLPGADHRREEEDATPPGRAAVLIGKLLAYLLLEAIILPVYLIVLPYFYGVPRLGGVGPILLLAVPFVLSVAGLGLVLAAIFRNPLAVQLATATLGLPFFMLAGFSWPAEAIPPAIHLGAYLLPSTSAIDGFTRLAQLGAPLSSVSSNLLTLWGLAIVYNLIALFCVKAPDPSQALADEPAPESGVTTPGPV